MRILQLHGYDNIAVLHGGLRAWRTAYPDDVESGELT